MKNPFISDIEKLKTLTFKQKVTYILDYYKFPFFIAVVVCFIFGGLLYTMISYDSDKVTVKLSVFDGVCMDVITASESINQAFVQYTGNTELEKETVILDTSFLGSSAFSDTLNQATTLQQLIASLSTGDINLMVASRDNLLSMASFDYMENLEAVLPETLYHQLEELGILLTCTVPSGISLSGQEYSYVCGIDLSSIPDNILTEIGYIMPEDAAIGIAVNAQHIELTLQLLNMIIEPMLQ